MKRLSLALTALLVASAAAPSPSYATDFYRQVKHLLVKAKQAATGPTDQPATETVPVWRLEGSKPIQMGSRLIDLGISTHTNLFLDGKLVGGGPYAYWGKFNENTVADLCAQIEGMGPYRCGITNGFNRVGLCVVRPTDLQNPLIFGTYDYNSGSVVTGPPELIGTNPVIRQTNAFDSDFCLVRPDNN